MNPTLTRIGDITLRLDLVAAVDLDDVNVIIHLNCSFDIDSCLVVKYDSPSQASIAYNIFVEEWRRQLRS